MMGLMQSSSKVGHDSGLSFHLGSYVPDTRVVQPLHVRGVCGLLFLLSAISHHVIWVLGYQTKSCSSFLTLLFRKYILLPDLWEVGWRWAATLPTAEGVGLVVEILVLSPTLGFFLMVFNPWVFKSKTCIGSLSSPKQEAAHACLLVSCSDGISTSSSCFLQCIFSCCYSYSRRQSLLLAFLSPIRGSLVC